MQISIVDASYGHSAGTLSYSARLVIADDAGVVLWDKSMLSGSFNPGEPGDYEFMLKTLIKQKDTIIQNYVNTMQAVAVTTKKAKAADVMADIATRVLGGA